MALSAQNQSTSYVNLYYSIVQRAATRYFKEYYNSGKYHIPDACMRVRKHHVHGCVSSVKKKRAPAPRISATTDDSPASERIARVRLCIV